MSSNNEVLGELIKAKENIKRKYTALKHGKADIHSIITETLKPIINPLNEIHKSTSQPREITVQNIEKKNNTENSRVFKINELLDSYSIDKTYGPKLQSNGDVYLGKKEIKLNGNTLIIEDTSYPLTQGLVNLIISKTPKIYTTDELNIYKRILIQTSAHLTTDEKKIKKGGNKFTDIIKPLFPSGNGLSVKLQKHNLVYWNNPNELVERLRLLLASQAAGNTGLSNEILSIYEELYEAADLVEMIPYSKQNKGFKYILCVIDCFTKLAWATPLKSKSAKEVSSAMSKILLKRAPKLLQLDNGKEFYNSTFDALMKKHNIHKYSTYSTMKACIVERFNRTLKEKMFREFTARGTHEWVSILPLLINEYNNSKHRTIGMTPVQADANPTSVEIKQRKIISRKIKFNIGDNVRISTYKGVFTKGYLPSWSTEIFKIVKINETLPTTYQLQDYTGKPIAGCFYSEEILKTNYPNDYLVEKIILTLENSISRVTDMNVFGSSQSGETNKFILNLEQSIKSFSSKLDKIDHLLEETHKSVLIQEEQTETIQLTCTHIVDRLKKINLDLIQGNTEVLKNILPDILSRLNTIETYFKDKP
ncbi:hypothetical protein QTP88_011307 [Uroleucon formosanum]